ncbi:MAG: pyridoxal-5'-phosphate-dependent protein subunit beta [Pseudomonadota bacterium]
MAKLGLECEIVDKGVYQRTIKRFKEANIAIPTFAQLADPATIPEKVKKALPKVDPDAPHSLNLFRVHWNNRVDRIGTVDIPDHVVLTEELTGVKAKIIVALGNRFPMIRTHKVLAAFGCLAPRVITGQFDPTTHKALWPSTGNYCRGGVAISRIMDCRGIAILPEGMSKERFQWLGDWVRHPEDIFRTPGSESNVKEIYDKCNELGKDPANIIFNQFCEFGNHLVHYLCTGKALVRAFETVCAKDKHLVPRAFVSATGSAGTIGAGDYLKEKYGSLTVAVEAVECPTILYNGFGEHNIQGIGDKHIPFIHNVMTTDLAVAIPERATDCLGVLFNTDIGRDYLTKRRNVPKALIDHLPAFGLSSICNILAAIKTAHYYQMGENDAILTIATDGYEMYETEKELALKKYFSNSFDEVNAGEVFGQHLSGMGTDYLLELSIKDKERIFNLGYYTWVEQQGVSIKEFTIRKDQNFWRDLRNLIPAWDEMITAFNKETKVLDKL